MNSGLLLQRLIRYARGYTPAPPIIPDSSLIQQRSNLCVRPRVRFLAQLFQIGEWIDQR